MGSGDETIGTPHEKTPITVQMEAIDMGENQNLGKASQCYLQVLYAGGWGVATTDQLLTVPLVLEKLQA